MAGTPFVEINRGTVANDGTGDSAYAGAGRINALIRAANKGQLSGFRNKLINGRFDVWQRGTSFIGTAKNYSADRWSIVRAAFAAGATLTQQAGFGAAVSPPSQYCARVQRDAGDSGTGVIYFGQQIESANVPQLQGQMIAISADVRAGANFSGTGVGIQMHTGTGFDESMAPVTGFPTGSITTVIAAQSISTTAARLTWTHTVPANATELGFAFRFNAPSGTAGAADYFEVTNAQLEIIDPTDRTPTPIEVRPIALEIAMCERFYEKDFALATAPAQNVGVGTGETRLPAVAAGAVVNNFGSILFRVPKRVAPSVVLYNPAAANAQAHNITDGADLSSTSAVQISRQKFDLQATGTAGTAIAEVIGIHWAASAEH